MSIRAAEDDDGERGQHDDRQQRHDVEPPDRIGGQLADAVQVEDRLGQDRAAADHLGEVEAPQRDDRDQAVAQDVADQHLALGQPLGPAVRT